VDAPELTSAPEPAVVAAIELIEDRVGADEAEVIQSFAAMYLRRVHEGVLMKLSTEQLAAHVIDLFRFADGRRLEPVAVRVFTPSVPTHGYSTGATVVEISTGDRPFLVDSATGEIHARDIEVERVIHPVIGTSRDATGRLIAVGPARNADVRESVQHYQLGRFLSDAEIKELEGGLTQSMRDVQRAVDDFGLLKARILRMIDLVRESRARYSDYEIENAESFLQWLLDLNFVFLGYREYEIVDVAGTPSLQVVPESGLGILRDSTTSAYARPVPMAGISPGLRARYETGDLLVITKANSVSTVHRRVKLDYIGVRMVDEDGQICGEARLLGIFTSKAYMAPASTVPLLAHKLHQIIEAEDLIEGSHDHKATIEIFESFPKEELFSSPIAEIQKSVMGLVRLRESQHVRLFVRRDLLNRSVAIVVALPRDRFNARLRKRLQKLFMERFSGTSVDYLLALGEVDPARIHFTVWVADGEVPDVSFEDLEKEVVAMTRTWEDRLTEELVSRVGEEEGTRLARKWAGRFPEYYQTSVELAVAAGDVIRLDAQDTGGQDIVIGLQNEALPGGDRPLTRLAVYCRHDKLPLSAMMPHLDALGLHVVEEVPTRLSDGASSGMFIHDFGVLGGDGNQLDIDECGERVAAAFDAVLEGRAESDSLNRLIITAGLSHRQVTVLRAYRTYWHRVAAAFTISYINDTLAAHPKMACRLTRLFEARFDPAADPEAEAPIREEIAAALDRVESLDEDRILRSFAGLIEATVRTNVYRDGSHSVAFKLRSADVPNMPRPFPLYEVFVYAPEVEGIHLRSGMVARGGIRWSTRREDYRTEVLGLMKAQVTKNAVIVPTGSKGGFVLRRPADAGTDIRNEVRLRYTTFIEGLLDVTDNLVGGKVVRPPGVRVHDGDDPYLVVAADKGTAALSDTANEVAARYGFWLGDAFASGGARGYDHKALGITARGAWESVKHHFREMGVDIQSEPFAVIGIGDMSGDVFGNGMLLSKHIRLVAAFDHRDIFIDPTPDPATSFAERERLFRLPRSSWQDYDRSLLSPGGAIFSRASKEVTLSPQARATLDTESATMTPNELIHTILQAPVDLLWNGGIGTYVKAGDESHRDVGDRGNDAIRVNGSELRCRVVGEGGNLGLTQRGRIEFAEQGGRLHTDFIDNSAGVHCSDREVNLKILLGLAEERGELDREERNRLVAVVADHVTDAIVYDNFLQAQILSQEAADSVRLMAAYEQGMELLEGAGMLDRAIEYLPRPAEMRERIRAGTGLTKPELSVLLAYGKRSLSEALLESDLPDLPYFETDLREYFPAPVAARFGHLIPSHPLRRELVATIVANQVMNSEGITFVTRLMDDTGGSPAEVVRAYRMAREITGAANRWNELETHVRDLEPGVLQRLLSNVDWLVESTAKWFLANPVGQQPINEVIELFRDDYEHLARVIGKTGGTAWRDRRAEAAAALRAEGVPDTIAEHHANLEDLIHAPDILELARDTGRSVEEVAGVFFRIGKAVRIDWLEQQAAALEPETRWERLAKEAAQGDLVTLRRRLAERVLARAGSRSPRDAIRKYLSEHPTAHGRLLLFMRQLSDDGVDSVEAVTVATRQIERILT
jgi:glutamate dehydrogenase